MMGLGLDILNGIVSDVDKKSNDLIKKDIEMQKLMNSEEESTKQRGEEWML